MDQRKLATAAAVATGVQVGAAMVATRFVARDLGPATLALLRYIIGFLCLLLPAWSVWRRQRFAPLDLLPIALLGIGQFGILIALLNFGLRTVPAGRGALLFASFPLMTMVLGAALGRERLTARKTAGVLLTMLGVGLAMGEKVLMPGQGGWWGEAAVLGAALCGAVCSVFYRPYLQKYQAVSVSAAAMLASVLFLAAVAGSTEGLFVALPLLSSGGWVAVLFIGVGSGAGYFLWLYALVHLPPTEVSIALSLSPLTAIGCGALLLGEPVGLGPLAGFVAVAAGMRLATTA
jgi:drug/metabolite transporter (DMT)-like permease